MRLHLAAASLAAISLTMPAFSAEHDKTLQSWTGCLQLTDDGLSLATKDGAMTLTGDVSIQEHEGHTVKVSGVRADDEIAISKVEHIAEGCEGQRSRAAAARQTSEQRRPQGETALGGDAEAANKVNQDGRVEHTPKAGEITADDQGGSKGDREVTAEVRRALVDDDSLSVSGKNVKVITRDGKVTLKGKVKSADEKMAIVAKAKSVAGDSNVDDRLKVNGEKVSSDRD